MTTPPNHNTADQSGADEFDAALWLRNNYHLYDNVGATCDALSIQLRNAKAEQALQAQTAQAVPAAWIATIQVGGGPEDPPDYDVVAVPGDTKPDDRNNWTPLYATPQPFPAPAVQSGDLDALWTFAEEVQWAHMSGNFTDVEQDVAITIALEKLENAGVSPNNGEPRPTQAIAQTAPAVAGEAMDAEHWAELHRLRQEVKGPDGYATWRDAAVDERLKRVATEKLLTEKCGTCGVIIKADLLTGTTCDCAAPSQGAKQ